MRFFLLAIFFGISIIFAASGASQKSMGIGGWLQAGNPGEHAGLDFQMRQAQNVIIDIYGHFYFSNGENSLGAYLGYYWNYYLLAVSPDLGRMGFYAGPVGGIGWWDNEFAHKWDEGGISIRFGVTGGFQWEFPVIPLQFFMELNPVGEFHYVWWEYNDHDDYSDTAWEIPDLYFRIGIRFWF